MAEPLRPLIVASLDGSGSVIAAARRARTEGADLLEIRIDLLSRKDRARLPELLRQAKKSARLPLIATVRGAREQGSKPISRIPDRERLGLFEAALPFAHFLDVELDSHGLNAQVVRLAHRRKKKTILSYHDFKGLPSRGKVRALAGRFKRLKGDVLKVAGRPRSLAEAGRFLELCRSLHPIPRIFIAMGPLGAVSRVAGFPFGSLWTYGHVGRAVAPGQLAVKDLAALRRQLYA